MSIVLAQNGLTLSPLSGDFQLILRPASG
jgi:hypothetical protein